MEKQRDLYHCFAALLNYPTPDLVDQARTCATLLTLDYPQAAAWVRDFLAFARKTPSGRLEEIYTATFDVNPTCFIYAGYILFGESFKRGKFLVRLQEEYRQRGFSWGNELADHLAVMVRFLAVLDDDDEELAQSLVQDCLLPVFTKMLSNFNLDAEHPHPYSQVLRALVMVLERTLPPVPLGEALVMHNQG